MKHLLKSTLMVAVLIFTAASAYSQSANTARVKVKGIGLDSTYSQVLRALGKPVIDGAAKEEGCIGSREKTIKYVGLSFYMMDGDSRDGKTFEVKSFGVTGSKWVVSGVRVGDSESFVRKRFGPKFKTRRDPETGGKIWSYEMKIAMVPAKRTSPLRPGKL